MSMKIKSHLYSKQSNLGGRMMGWGGGGGNGVWETGGRNRILEDSGRGI